MNVKKMTSEHLQETIEGIRAHQDELSAYNREISQSEGDFLEACEKELKRRWGIRTGKCIVCAPGFTCLPCRRSKK